MAALWTSIQQTIWAFVLLMLTFLPLLVIGEAARLWLKRKFHRTSPLTQDLLRPPGYSLRLKLYDLDINLTAAMTLVIVMPVVVYAVHLSESYFWGKPESVGRTGVAVFMVLVFMGTGTQYIFRTMTEMRKLYLGLDGEMAVAQELDQLMLEGCRVFHDIPYQYGNIDHVVVSRSGVYCINTKMRGKPRTDNKAEVIIDYNKGVLRFPDATVPIPVAAAETESRWLSRHLSESTGEPVSVEPMLAFPGWYFKQRIGKGSVFIFNPTRPQKFFLRSQTVNTPERIKQIAYQLERLVRNVEPRQKDQKSGWQSDS